MHGLGTYDYSQVVYTDSRYKVKIICSEHGVFEQKANNHLLGYGCKECGRKRWAGGRKALKTEDFIAKSQAVHGLGAYDYSQVVYSKHAGVVSICCPKHGLFKQRANSHLMGSGCPSCGEERRVERSSLSWIEQAQKRVCTLYFLRLYSDKEEFYKVGITVHSVSWRYQDKNRLMGYKYEVLATYKSNATAVAAWEQSILETFAYLRYKPKHSFGGATECFSSADEILAIFPL